MSCPRCRAAEQDCVQELQGKEDDAVIWTVYHCTRCSFTWRDSEPERTISYDVREAWFRVDTDNLDQYPHNIPPSNLDQ